MNFLSINNHTILFIMKSLVYIQVLISRSKNILITICIWINGTQRKKLFFFLFVDLKGTCWPPSVMVYLSLTWITLGRHQVHFFHLFGILGHLVATRFFLSSWSTGRALGGHHMLVFPLSSTRMPPSDTMCPSFLFID